MNDFEEIDRLLDKSLNSDINYEEILKLETICSKNDENLNYYLQLIDEHVALRNTIIGQNLTALENYQHSKVMRFPYWLIIILVIVIPIFYIAFSKATMAAPELLTISPRSYGLSLIRQQQEVKHTNNLQLRVKDHLRVRDKGELWLNIPNRGSIYLAPGSILSINHHSQESLTLIKGSLSATVKKGPKPFIFTTADSELRITQGKIKVLVSESSTIQLHQGNGQFTRLADGKKQNLKSGDKVNSKDFNITKLNQQEINSFSPALLNGIRYSYHELVADNIPGNFKAARELDQGLTNLFKIKRGEHEGFTRHQHDMHSHIHTSDFHISFKALLNIPQTGDYSFKLTGSAPSKLSLANQIITTAPNLTEAVLSANLEQGLHFLEIQTIGIIENDTPGYSMRLTMRNGKEPFQDIPIERLYYSDPDALPSTFQDQNIDKKLAAHLPLKGSFKDKVNKEEAAPFGSPQFTLDSTYGPVLKLDGQNDYLVHYPVDKLGMNISYTAALWLNMEEQKHYDQVIFSNKQDAGGISSNLVILIRRMYPYLAHLSNDTIADEKINYNEWTHLVFRYHEGKQSIFINGKLAISSFNHTILSSHNSLIIGNWNNGRFLKGKLRDIRIYNTPLSSSDIKTLYDQTK